MDLTGGSDLGGRAGERWFDSHCHLQDRYVPDGSSIDEALLRAAGAGVRRIVCVGTDSGTSCQALELARAARAARAGGEPGSRPEVWASVGLHPHDATADLDPIVGILESEAARPDGVLVAVGECGLDYHYEHAPRDAQRRVFEAQLALAQRFELTLVIHAREAWDDLFGIIDSVGLPARTILHCFTGGPFEIQRCLEAGMYVSFSGIVTFKNAREVREAAERCPLDRLLVETDSPFLAPVPHRGRPNEPAYVPLVGQVVAELKQIEPVVLAETSWAAASTAFGV